MTDLFWSNISLGVGAFCVWLAAASVLAPAVGAFIRVGMR